MQGASDPRLVRRVASRSEAEALAGSVLATLAALDAALAAETAHVRAGRIREGLAEEARKSELTAAYLRDLEAVKANAVALARFAPDAVGRLKSAHAEFTRRVEANRMVLATARAVSEGLIKSVSEEIDRAARPSTYGRSAGAAARPAQSAPLVLSRSL